MQAYQLAANRGLDDLALIDRAPRALGGRDVRVQVEAAALNYRDLMIANGQYGLHDDLIVTPGSDGVGTIVDVGNEVVRQKVGDRVLPAFWPDWIDGPITAAKTTQGWGAGSEGTLADEIVGSETAFAPTPSSLTAVEAATLPCAGVTAWNALFVAGALRPGASVLLLGTGGVSIWALQLAAAAGLRAIVTSSSDAKLERAKALGASATINYRETPDWAGAARALTDGEGVDLVVEIGGAGTIGRSIASVRRAAPWS